MGELEKLIDQIVKGFQSQKVSNTVWCDSLLVKDQVFDKVSINVEYNYLNLVTNININFYAKNPPQYYFTEVIKPHEFLTQEDLNFIIKKAIKKTNNNIAEEIFRAAQLNMFD